MKNFVQRGEVITWTNGTGADVVSGQVVAIGQILGVATGDIASTAVGEVALTGVFTVPKVTAAVIAQGEGVLWDVSVAKFDDNLAVAATGDVTGGAVAWEAAGNGATTLKVRLTNSVCTVT